MINAEITKCNSSTDFYYDPHNKHYTGLRKILKGWCAKVKMADKVLNMDFIHTSKGYPVYLKTIDNYYDLRERFFTNVQEFRQLAVISSSQIITLVVDRGIYSIDVFDDIIKSDTQHIITWEKDYKKDRWDETTPNQGVIIRARNCSTDRKLITYKYQDKLWPKDQRMRQLIVRMPLPKGRNILEVSILTDDLNREATEIINLIFSRWVQENDFKYLNKHFGINEISSYEYANYKDLKDKVEDKLAISGQYKSLTKEIKRISKRLKTALLRKYKFEKQHENRKKTCTVKQQQQKEKILAEVAEWNLLLETKEQERKEINKKVSKLEDLIEQEYQILETNTKTLMDIIKIIARNIFYLTIQGFKDRYDNYRDDHVLFRALSMANGIIKVVDAEEIITLYPINEFTPKVKRIIRQTLEEINAMKPTMLNGSNRKITLKLCDKIDSFFAFAN